VKGTGKRGVVPKPLLEESGGLTMKFRVRSGIGLAIVTIAVVLMFFFTDFRDPGKIIAAVAMAVVLFVPYLIDFLPPKGKIPEDGPGWLRIFENFPPRKLQFTLARMIVATATVAIVFATFKIIFTFKEPAVTMPAVLLAAALGGLAFDNRKNRPQGHRILSWNDPCIRTANRSSSGPHLLDLPENWIDQCV
jgi:hypothetical protein